MPIPMTEEKIMERVRLLLNKAEGTDNEHEAQAFSDQANRLMVQFEIDSAAVEADRRANGNAAPTEPITVHREEFGTGYALVEARFYSWIAQAFGLRAVIHSRTKWSDRTWTHSTDRSYRAVSIIGHEGDVQRALTAIRSLRLQATNALAVRERDHYDFKYAYGAERTSMRRSYLLAFASGASARIKANRRQAQQEVKGTGTDVVLVDRKAAVDRYVETEYPKLGNLRPPTLNEAAQRAGLCDGRAASTGERQVGGTRALEG